MGPESVQGPGRHGPVDHPHMGGHERREQVTSSPGHGETGHVELGTQAQGPEGPEAEHADAGAEPEERRGVDGHPEPAAPQRITGRHPGSLAHRGSGPEPAAGH